MICNRTKQTIWPLQKAYIMKIYNNFIQINPLRFLTTPIEFSELLSIDKDKIVSDFFKTLYEQKVGLLLFAAISTRPNIAFAILRLSKFNQRPGYKHHKVANRVFHYLFSTQDYCIRYGGDVQDLSSFVYVNDASFGNNTLDQKGS